MAKSILTARIVLDGPTSRWETQLFDDAGTSPEDVLPRLVNVLNTYSIEGVRVQLQLSEATETAASASFTITNGNLAGADTTLRIVAPGEINSYEFTAVTSGAETGNFEFNIGASGTSSAISLVTAIDSSLSRLFDASSTSNQVTITAKQLGSIGNDIVLEDISTSNALSITTTNLSGGYDVLEEQETVTVTVDASSLVAATSALTIGNVTLTAVTTAANDTENEFTIDLTESTDALDDAATARNLAAEINNHSLLGGIFVATVPDAGDTDDNVVTIKPRVGASPEVVALLTDISEASNGLTLSTNKKFDGTITYTNKRANESFGKTVK